MTPKAPRFCVDLHLAPPPEIVGIPGTCASKRWRPPETHCSMATNLIFHWCNTGFKNCLFFILPQKSTSTERDIVRPCNISLFTQLLVQHAVRFRFVTYSEHAHWHFNERIFTEMRSTPCNCLIACGSLTVILSIMHTSKLSTLLVYSIGKICRCTPACMVPRAPSTPLVMSFICLHDASDLWLKPSAVRVGFDQLSRKTGSMGIYTPAAEKAFPCGLSKLFFLIKGTFCPFCMH